jgi:hypothetical protein
MTMNIPFKPLLPLPLTQCVLVLLARSAAAQGADSDAYPDYASQIAAFNRQSLDALYKRLKP